MPVIVSMPVWRIRVVRMAFQSDLCVGVWLPDSFVSSRRRWPVWSLRPREPKEVAHLISRTRKRCSACGLPNFPGLPLDSFPTSP